MSTPVSLFRPFCLLILNFSFPIIRLRQAKKKPRKGLFHLGSSALLSRKYRDPLSLFVFSLVPDHAVDQCKQREVPAHADVLSRMNTGAELAHQNIAGAHRFSAENFHAAPLPLTVATV